MKENGKASDWFNSLNGNLDLRLAVLENSNKLKQMGVDSPGKIERLYKSGDFLAFNDPLKLKNLEMFGIDNELTDQILVAEVMDETRGHKVYQFINISDTDKMKRGDILTLNPEKEGKEAGTEFQEAFEEYCMNIVKEKIPNIDKVASREDIMKALGLNTYEDVIYMAAKTGGLRENILEKIKTPEDRKNFVSELGADKNELTKDEEGKEVFGEETEKENEEDGMTVEEASKVLGIDEEKLKESVGDKNRILGSNRTKRTGQLSDLLQYDFSDLESEVILLKVAGPGIKSQGLILSKDGTPICTPKQIDTKVITELVKDGSNGEEIKDVEEKLKERDAESRKIETKDPTTGKTTVEFVEKGNEKAVREYESEAEMVMAELEKRLKIIEDGPGKESEKMEMKANVLFSAKGRLEHLQEAYGIQEQDSLDKMENVAKEEARDAETQELFETGEEIVGTVAGMAVAAGASVLGIKKVKEDEEEEEKQHLTPAEEAMRKRGFNI